MSTVPSQAAVAVANERFVFGQSGAMQALWRQVSRLAAADVPVLLQGETGTGKDELAQLIHHLSRRGAAPFVKVSCPAIPSTLLESELFGYEKGSFTGATVAKPGWVEQAHGGSLYLDHIAELDGVLQAKLLQLLQDGTYFRIGGQAEASADVRMICSTNRNLESEIEAGTFRRDLFYRINVVAVTIPPLRERGKDIRDLADHFLRLYNARYDCQARPLSASTMVLLSRHSWPGNVRELENLVRRYVVLNCEEQVRAELSGASPCQPRNRDCEAPLQDQLDGVLRDVERKAILRALEANQWNRKQAARELRISYRALFYRMKAVGLPAKAGHRGRARR